MPAAPTRKVLSRFARDSLLSILAFALSSSVVLSCRLDRPASGPSKRQPPADSLLGPFVRVLGTAQDGGFPHAACSGRNCRGARSPSQRRLISSLALVLPKTRSVYLFDATPDLREQLDLLSDVRHPPLDKVDRTPVTGVFLTHAHIGHYLGLAYFGFEAVHTRDLSVYCTPSMADFLRGNGPWSLLVERANIQLHEFPAGSTLQLPEGVSVTSIASPHRDEYSDTVGFRIRGPRGRLLYLPDTDAWDLWPVPLPDLVANTDIAILDGTFFSPDELPGRSVASIGHPLMAESMDRLRSTIREGRVRVLFTHLNHSNPALLPDSEARREIHERGFEVASEGEEFPL